MKAMQWPGARTAPPKGITPPASFDASRPATHTAALKGSWFDGFAYGERLGFVAGWRWGAVTGAGVSLLLAAGAVAAAKHLGWL